MYAVICSNTEMVESMASYLLNKNDTEVVTATNKYGHNVFMLVAKYGNDKMMECLKQFLTSELVAAKTNSGNNLCMFIAIYGTNAMMEAIVKFLTPEIVGMVNKKGNNAYMTITKRGKDDMLETIKPFLNDAIVLPKNRKKSTSIDLLQNKISKMRTSLEHCTYSPLYDSNRTSTPGSMTSVVVAATVRSPKIS